MKKTKEELLEYEGWDEVLETVNRENFAVRVYADSEKKTIWAVAAPDLSTWEDFDSESIEQISAIPAGYFHGAIFTDIGKFLDHYLYFGV